MQYSLDKKALFLPSALTAPFKANAKKTELTSGDVDLVAFQLAQGRCPSNLQAKKSFFYHPEISDWRHRCFGVQK